jgi:hypothetical protein
VRRGKAKRKHTADVARGARRVPRCRRCGQVVTDAVYFGVQGPWCSIECRDKEYGW